MKSLESPEKFWKIGKYGGSLLIWFFDILAFSRLCFADEYSEAERRKSAWDKFVLKLLLQEIATMEFNIMLI